MRRLITIVILLAIIALLLWPRSTSGTPPKDTANQDSPYTTEFTDIFKLPSDICLHEGMPVIYANEYEAHANYAFSYMNKSGVIISLSYSNVDLLDSTYNLYKSTKITGGSCVP
jgi:hypothetical protein